MKNPFLPRSPFLSGASPSTLLGRGQGRGLTDLDAAVTIIVVSSSMFFNLFSGAGFTISPAVCEF